MEVVCSLISLEQSLSLQPFPLAILSAVLVTIAVATTITACRRWSKETTLQRKQTLEYPISEQTRDTGSLVLIAGGKSIVRSIRPSTQNDTITTKPVQQSSIDAGELVLS